MKISSRFMAVLYTGFFTSLFFASTAVAQHAAHQFPGAGALNVTTVPENNEVLAEAPSSLMLHFDTRVALLKLAVKEPGQGKEPLDIGFRYRPETAVHFEHALPSLHPADYYLVEWAAYAVNGDLVKGSFYFSFGNDAMPPSHYREQMEHSTNLISPDYRLIQ